MFSKKNVIIGIIFVLIITSTTIIGYFGFREYQNFQLKKSVGQSISNNKNVLSSNGELAKKNLEEITSSLGQTLNASNSQTNSTLEINVNKLRTLTDTVNSDIAKLDAGVNGDTKIIQELAEKVLKKRFVVFSDLLNLTQDFYCANQKLTQTQTNFNQIAQELAKIDPANTTALNDQINIINQQINTSVSTLNDIYNCNRDSNNPIINSEERVKIEQNIELLEKIKETLVAFAEAYKAKDLKKMEEATKALKSIDASKLTTAIKLQTNLISFKTGIEELTQLEKDFNQKVQEISGKYGL